MFCHLKELYEHRELILSLGLRELKARYKQTVFGISWALVQPLSMMLILTLVFSRIAKLPSDGIPYPIFVYSTLVFWQFFTLTFSQGTTSLVGNASLVRKVYFPREICFLAIFFSAAADLAISFALLLVLRAYYALPLTWNLLWIAPILAVQVLFTLGLVSLTSSLHVRFRDIGHALPLVNQIWMFASPVAYSLSAVPASLLPFYLLNPMAAIMDSYRRVIVLNTGPNLEYLAASLLTAAVLFGIFYPLFKRSELHFADVI
ncbi:MAG TPA: ABC transporter permease [Candidatus Acidoferrales bacterium]|nr:ABC transporter permease [Candidatus Acidoferrales bacterium]